jgi:class 3 adenylate cyclase
MQAFMRARHEARTAQGLPAFEMRAGVHTGAVVAGIVGSRKFQYDIWGDAVNTAARMESSGEAGRVNISGATHALAVHAPDLAFFPRGRVSAKGKGELEMWFAELRQG